jgi:heterodisulfide reductase subunit B
MEFEEIEDWNCCGASVSYAGANDLSIKVLNARNLALAEAKGSYDIVAPCSSCYIQMIKVNHEIQEDPELLKQVNECLAEGGLSYKGGIKVRHIQDVLYNDVGLDKIKEKVVKPLNGLKIAGYVGCQSVRPYGEYDSVDKPVVQDRLLEALGAEAVPFPKKISCCGSGIFLPEIDYCMELVKDILEDAINHGAELVSTVCPMCAMNLEMYQGRINERYGTDFDIPIVYLTQLMAVAFGLDMKKDAALNYNVIPPEGILQAALGH